MTIELESLLALQEQDDVVDALQARVEALTPRAAALDAVRERAQQTLAETKALVDADERRQRELEGRISDHRQRHERNVAHLDAVKRMREATAAMMQVEAGRKLLAEEESELRGLVGRVADGHAAIRKQSEDLEALELEQSDARQELAAEREQIEGELREARAVRDGIAAKVDPVLLRKYERIRGRRHAQALFVLSGSACGSCDTAVPIQRRKAMSATGAIEVCETCGVLLYAAE